MIPVGVHQGAVDIVAEDKDGLVLQDVVDGVQGLLGVDAAGGVVGRGEDHRLGFGSDGPGQRLRVDLEGVVLRGQGHGHAPAQPGDGLVEAEGGGGDDDLVPGIEHRGKRQEQALRGADGEDDLLRGVVQAVDPGLKIRDGLQHVGIAVAGGIVGIVGVQGGLGGLLDGVRGIQVRLADGQGAGSGGVPHQKSKPADAGKLHIQYSAVQRQIHGSHAPFSNKDSICA